MSAAGQELSYYLKHGKRTNYSGGVPMISSEEVKTLAVRAGYVEFALGAIWFDRISPAGQRYNPETDFVTTVHDPNNRFGLPVGYTMDGVIATNYVINSFPPDLPLGEDPIQARILSAISDVEALIPQLREDGKRFFALEPHRWGMGMDGTVRFSLNPMDQLKYAAGFFTAEELKGWKDNDPESPVLKVNDDKRRETDAYRPRMYPQDMWRNDMHQAVDTGDPRMLSIALMRCPMEDVAAEFSR